MVAQKLKELEVSKQRLDELTTELQKRGYLKAQAEREYRKELAKKLLGLRSRGNNVPSNLAADMARGDEKVSELRYQRDIAIINYDVCKERLRDEKMQIEILRSLLAFDRANYLNS